MAASRTRSVSLGAEAVSLHACVTSTAPAPPPPRVTCTSYAVCDAATGEVLVSRGAAVPCQIASITKVMTAHIVISLARAEIASRKGTALVSGGLLDELVLVSAEAAAVQGTTADIRTGEVYTVRDLLYGMMLPSGNDAAAALAEYVGGSFALPPTNSVYPVRQRDHPHTRFVAEMNREAARLGLTQTRFGNPHGLSDSKQQSCAADVCKLAAVASRDPLLRDITSARSYTACVRAVPEKLSRLGKWNTLASGVRRTYPCMVAWTNTNVLLGSTVRANVEAVVKIPLPMPAPAPCQPDTARTDGFRGRSLLASSRHTLTSPRAENALLASARPDVRRLQLLRAPSTPRSDAADTAGDETSSDAQTVATRAASIGSHALTALSVASTPLRTSDVHPVGRSTAPSRAVAALSAAIRADGETAALADAAPSVLTLPLIRGRSSTSLASAGNSPFAPSDPASPSLLAQPTPEHPPVPMPLRSCDSPCARRPESQLGKTRAKSKSKSRKARAKSQGRASSSSAGLSMLHAAALDEYSASATACATPNDDATTDAATPDAVVKAGDGPDAGRCGSSCSSSSCASGTERPDASGSTTPLDSTSASPKTPVRKVTRSSSRLRPAAVRLAAANAALAAEELQAQLLASAVSCTPTRSVGLSREVCYVIDGLKTGITPVAGGCLCSTLRLVSMVHGHDGAVPTGVTLPAEVAANYIDEKLSYLAPSAAATAPGFSWASAAPPRSELIVTVLGSECKTTRFTDTQAVVAYALRVLHQAELANCGNR